MILIYSNEINPRIEYIFKLIFNQILQVEVNFTTKSAEFLKSDLPKINYSYEKFRNEFYIKPHRLLYCKALIQPDIQPVWYEGQKFFCESSKDSDLPFDPFAASFYLVTRYEEYIETELGKYNRYQASRSILSKYNLLKKPIVNIWADLLAEKLKEKFPQFQFPKRKFEFYSTIDIDNAWAYKNKGLVRTLGALAKLFSTGNFKELRKRSSVLVGNETDPYDSYQFLYSVFKNNEENVIFFFLLGDYGKYDKNISHKNKSFRKLIQQTTEKYNVGIHPSFKSSKKKDKKNLKKEKTRLEDIINKNVEKSRQHYLRLKFPRIYRSLLNEGIKEDYTMGYASSSGFRAGICTPYFFYDLKKETTTNLKIVPFQIMDVTLRDYLGLTPDEATKEIDRLMQEVKNVNGTFISIWHNETVTDIGHWKGYRDVFEKMNRKGFEWANEK